MYGRVVTGLSPVSKQSRKAWNNRRVKIREDCIRVWGNQTHLSFVRVERTLILALYRSRQLK